jgi:hypothetical protein
MNLLLTTGNKNGKNNWAEDSEWVIKNLHGSRKCWKIGAIPGYNFFQEA